MTVVIIELNDGEIRVADAHEIILRSPGFAVGHNENIEVGTAAARQARLNPLAVYDRYWSNLNQDPLQNPSAYARHHADLAYAHLLALHEQSGEPDEVLFAVPGTFSNDQLALLLGLVEASPFNRAVGLVDISVAAAASVAASGYQVHVDLHLHRVLITHLTVDEQVTRGEVQVVDGVGLSEMFDLTASAIADLFIRQTRFDPQHHAETEQLLYDQIPQCLQTLLEGSDATVEIPYQGIQYDTKVAVDSVRTALAPLYKRIVEALPTSDTKLVSDRLANFPGLIGLISGAQLVLADSVFEGCRSQLQKIHSQGPTLDFVTSLPASGQSAAMEAPSAGRSKPLETLLVVASLPTHIMRDNRAYAINDRPLYLSSTDGTSRTKTAQSRCSVSKHSDEVIVRPEGDISVLLNGLAVKNRAAVRGGDVIGLIGTDAEYLLINVCD